MFSNGLNKKIDQNYFFVQWLKYGNLYGLLYHMDVLFGIVLTGPGYTDLDSSVSGSFQQLSPSGTY